MFGLIVSLVWFATVYFLGLPSTFPEAFSSATNLLFWWYVVTSIISGGIIILISIGVIGVGTLIGGRAGGFFGGLLGLIGGSALSFLILLVSALRTACAIGGAYLLSHSLIVSNVATDWDILKLVFGALLLVISLVIGAGYSSKK